MLPRADMESAPTDRQACALNGSLCETDSPDTGEVARSARRGALSAKLTEGETNKLAPVKSKALSPHPLARDYFVAGPLCRWRDISPRCGESPSQRGPFSKVAAFSTVTIYLSLYLIPRRCATVSERKRLLFAVFIWAAGGKRKALLQLQGITLYLVTAKVLPGLPIFS